MTKKDKVTVDDIIGIVKCEQTDSVEEVRKLRGRTNERFMVDTAGTLIDMVTRDTFDYVSDVVDLLNELTDVNNQLQKQNDNLVNMIARVQCRADLIKEENEQLKADKQRLIDFIRKEFPKSHKHILEGFE